MTTVVRGSLVDVLGDDGISREMVAVESLRRGDLVFDAVGHLRPVFEVFSHGVFADMTLCQVQGLQAFPTQAISWNNQWTTLMECGVSSSFVRSQCEFFAIILAGDGKTAWVDGVLAETFSEREFVQELPYQSVKIRLGNYRLKICEVCSENASKKSQIYEVATIASF